MKTIIEQIQALDLAQISAHEIFKQSHDISEEIIAQATFNDISLPDAQTVRNMLNAVVKKKLDLIESQANQKIIVKQDFDIQKEFVQKVAKTLQNTKELVPPFYNMGEPDTQQASESWAFPRHLDNYQLISTPQGVVPVLRSCPSDNEIAHHDWVTFSFDASTLGQKYGALAPQHIEACLGDGIQTYLDQILFEIFGFGIAQKRKCGMHFYKYGFDLQDNLGLVLYGHKSNRISVQINGTGCALARKGWNEQLYDFLKKACKNPKLNRVDLAFDDLHGDFLNIDLINQWDDEDLFFTKGNHPEFNTYGDFKRINGKGRTITIGSRKSGKYARFYERGKKEGDALSLWLRAEIEYKSTDTYIPLDILLKPSSYFIGAYPACQRIADIVGYSATPEKVQIVKKQALINLDKAIAITKNQFGKYIRQFRKIYDDAELLNLISSSKDEMPKRLIFSQSAVNQSLRINQPTYAVA
jgi:phage replication initiation protein